MPMPACAYARLPLSVRTPVQYFSVAAMSIVVNYASGMTAGHITHEETLHFGKVAEQNVTKLVKSFVADMDSWA